VICPVDKRTLLLPWGWERTIWLERAKRAAFGKACTICKCVYLNAGGLEQCRADGSALIKPVLDMDDAPVFDEQYQAISFYESDEVLDVYLAQDLDTNQIVFVKVMNSRMRGDERTANHFLEIGRRALGLKHPNIVAVRLVEMFYPHNAPYMVTDYVIARSIKQEMEFRKRFDAKSATGIIIDVLNALQYAHEKDIVHAALSKSNIFVTGSDGHSCIGLLDNFGVAERLFRELDWNKPSTETRTANIYGSPDGMCPEFCLGQRPSKLSDIYQIGCVMYEMLTGRPPFINDSVTMTLIAHMEQEPESLQDYCEASEDLQNIVLRCLKKDPAERFSSAKELSSELTKFRT
jgi:serine/threonine-protein kinase